MAEGGTFYSGFFFSESFIQVLHNNPWDWEIGIYGLEKSCNYHITMCRHASRHIECPNCCPGWQVVIGRWIDRYPIHFSHNCVVLIAELLNMLPTYW